MSNEAAAAEATLGEEVKTSTMEDALNGALDALDDDGAPTGPAASTPADDAAGGAPADGDADGAATGEEDAGADDDDPDGKAASERDKQGRFKTKDKAAAEGDDGDADAGKDADGKPTADGDDPDKKAEGDDDAQAAVQMVDGRDISKPPTSWKKEAVEGFDKLPENVRREIHRREEDMHRGIEQYKGAATFGSDVAKLFQPYQQMLETNRIVPTELIGAALQFEKAMRDGTPEERAGIVKNLAAAYGLDLSGVEIKEGEVDPRYQALQTEVSELKGKLTDREKREQEAAQQEEQAAREATRKEIEAFASDPKNEHYGLVKEDMLKLISSGQASDLRDAYDKAIWVNPVTREKLIASQREVERKSAAEKAAAARKANSVNVTPRATPPAKPSGKSTMEDALGAALDEVLAH